MIHSISLIVTHAVITLIVQVLSFDNAAIVLAFQHHRVDNLKKRTADATFLRHSIQIDGGTKRTINQRRRYNHIQRDQVWKSFICAKPGVILGLSESSSSVNSIRDNLADDEYNNGDINEDEHLLNEVTKQQLQILCEQLNLSTTGTKVALLGRLRSHAKAQRQREAKLYQERVERIREQQYTGDSNSKERYEILYDGDDNYDNEPGNYFIASEDKPDNSESFFSYYADSLVQSLRMASSNSTLNQNATGNDTSVSSLDPKSAAIRVITNADITAPPIPPCTETNEDGERVVTVYSTTEQNDLTGIAASQPGSNYGVHSLSLDQNQPLDEKLKQKQALNALESTMIENVKEQITGLVQTLLSMTGLPAFELMDDVENVMDSMNDDEDIHDGDDEQQISKYRNGKKYFVTNKNNNKGSNNNQKPTKFIGFLPENVPVDLLASCSQALMLRSKDDALDDLLRYYEIQAIGYDGMKGDDVSKGGGHYVQVQKVRSFLEGYRTALRRKQARTTIVLLLEKLMQEGVQGLDLLLSSMSVGSKSDNMNRNMYSDEIEPQLNEGLFEFLNDAIRQQQKKVESNAVSQNGLQTYGNIDSDESVDDPLNQLWNVTTDEDGYRVESIDPNNPSVKRLIEKELMSNNRDKANDSIDDYGVSTSFPNTGSEQLLLLLKLLRERIKVEVTYSKQQSNEKSNNLRLLAYCIQSKTATDREQLMLQHVGYSTERLDSFIELVNSSIEYGESTSYELQPGQLKSKLDLPLLRNVLEQAIQLRQVRQRTASSSTF